MVGTGLAASYGILIKGADVLEKTKSIDTIVFDKTGTLTSGKQQVKSIVNCQEQFNTGSTLEKEILLRLAFLAEMSSEHPIGKSICTKLKEEDPQVKVAAETFYKLKDFENIDGEGVRTSALDAESGQEISVAFGNTKLMNRICAFEQHDAIERQIGHLEAEGTTVVTLAVNGVPELIFTLAEESTCKPEARRVVQQL
mmetsp:Transcript_37534/g.57514  ORF Transcript_37534/g.57514 Transcript_37534/m.57514 type:complete len:198 (+) Transcript_37534:1771-2364(+)